MDVTTAEAAPRSPRMPQKVNRLTGENTTDEAIAAHKLSKCNAVPEIEAYIQLLVVLYLLDNKCKAEVRRCGRKLFFKRRGNSGARRRRQPGSAHRVVQSSLNGLFNGTLLLLFGAAEGRIRSAEGDSVCQRRRACIQGEFHPYRFMLGRLRIATLREDSETVATLINCILNAYFTNHMYSHAEKFFARVSFAFAGDSEEVLCAGANADERKQQ